METAPSFVDVRGVSVEYRHSPGLLGLLGQKPVAYSALRDITFRLPLGANLILFGHEGSGKTTLLRLLTGQLIPTTGTVRVNGQAPHAVRHIAAGYVSCEETEPDRETGYQVLTAFARTHNIYPIAARVREVSDILKLGERLFTPAQKMSSAGRLRLNLARAALSDTPLILLDDVAEQLGVAPLAEIIPQLFSGRTVLVATRHATTAEALHLPLLLLHKGRLAHHGTIDEIAADLFCPRVVDVWIEGLRYDLLRQLRKHAGVIEARLIPTSSFSGQRLRITLHSARYLPSIYDLVSQTPLVRVEELPSSFYDIIKRL